jgi:hypothetical protein
MAELSHRELDGDLVAETEWRQVAAAGLDRGEADAPPIEELDIGSRSHPLAKQLLEGDMKVMIEDGVIDDARVIHVGEPNRYLDAEGCHVGTLAPEVAA